jgi:hypothetical protein
MEEYTGPTFGIVLSAIPGRVYTRENSPLKLSFVNMGSEEMRVLRHFDPLPVFFAFGMKDEDGRYLSIPGAGKIDFYKGSIPYENLPPGGSFEIEVNLAEILAYPDEAHPGEYTIKATYHNQYGENCFQGAVSSNTITVSLVSVPEASS